MSRVPSRHLRAVTHNRIQFCVQQWYLPEYLIFPPPYSPRSPFQLWPVRVRAITASGWKPTAGGKDDWCKYGGKHPAASPKVRRQITPPCSALPMTTTGQTAGWLGHLRNEKIRRGSLGNNISQFMSLQYFFNNERRHYLPAAIPPSNCLSWINCLTRPFIWFWQSSGEVYILAGSRQLICLTVGYFKGLLSWSFLTILIRPSMHSFLNWRTESSPVVLLFLKFLIQGIRTNWGKTEVTVPHLPW